MKKSALFLPVLVAVMFSSSCKKDREEDSLLPDPGKGAMGVKNATLSPGEIHNLILTEYLDTYQPAPDGEITVDEAHAEILAISQIAQSQGFLTHRTADDMADAILTHQIESGYFVNGVSKPTETIRGLVIQKVENQSIRAALLQISELADQGDEDFEGKSQQILSQLGSLTVREQTMIDGFGSVLGHSLVLWKGQPSLTELAHQLKVSVADAIGYIDGFLWAGECYFWRPEYLQHILAEARDFAAVASARADKQR